jgi:hypothetical protein
MPAGKAWSADNFCWKAWSADNFLPSQLTDLYSDDQKDVLLKILKFRWVWEQSHM